MESADKTPPLDDLVDQLLRDQDFLLAREIRQRVDELNRMLAQAHRQKLRVEAAVSAFPTGEGDPVAYLDVRIYRQI